MSISQQIHHKGDSKYPAPFNYIRHCDGFGTSDNPECQDTAPEIFDTLEAKLTLALSGPGENQGFNWAPTSEGEGLRFTFPKSLGKCSGEVVRLQEGVYLVTRSLDALLPFGINTWEQRGLYFMFLFRGCANAYIPPHGNTILNGPIGINFLSPEQTAVDWVVNPGVPMELITVAFRDVALLHEFGVPQTWYPDRLMDWLKLPKQDSGFSVSRPSGESIAAARRILNCDFEGPLRRLYLAGMCRELVAHMISSRILAGDFLSARSLHRVPRDRVAESVKVLIDSDPAQKWSIKSLAAHLAIGPNKLMRDFKAQYAETINAYLRRRRLERARDLLLNTRRSITEIAISVGYAQVNYFSDAFRSAYHCSPSQFRRNSDRQINKNK